MTTVNRLHHREPGHESVGHTAMFGGYCVAAPGLVGLVIDTHDGDFVTPEVLRIDDPATAAPEGRPVL
jgi:hypothetical protein